MGSTKELANKSDRKFFSFNMIARCTRFNIIATYRIDAENVWIQKSFEIANLFQILKSTPQLSVGDIQKHQILGNV